MYLAEFYQSSTNNYYEHIITIIPDNLLNVVITLTI